MVLLLVQVFIQHVFLFCFVCFVLFQHVFLSISKSPRDGEAWTG